MEINMKVVLEQDVKGTGKKGKLLARMGGMKGFPGM